MRSFAALVVLGALPAFAKDPRSELTRLSAEVEQEQSKLKKLTGEERETERRLQTLEDEVRRIEGQEQALRRSLEGQTSKVTVLVHEVREVEARIDAIRNGAVRRLRALYMESHPRSVQKTLALDPQNLLRRTVYFSYLERQDRAVLAELRASLAERAEKQQALDVQTLEARRLADSLRAASAEKQRQIAGQRALADVLKEQRRSSQETISALRARSLRLETIVRSITGGESDARVEAARQRSESAVGTGSLMNFDGPGWDAVPLSAPAEGKLVHGYGESRPGRWGQALKTKGLELAVREGGKIRSIAAGQVIYVGRLPMFGLVVIIDHGARSYSLYGRLARTEVSLGSLVSQSDSLGEAGAPDAEGRSFYFELRKAGWPVDPMPYFSKYFNKEG